MKRAFRIIWRSLLVAVIAIGFFAWVIHLPVWTVIGIILVVFLLSNGLMLFTKNRNLAKRNLRALVDGVSEDFINIKTWITE